MNRRGLVMRTAWVALGLATGAVALAGCNPAKIGENRNERPLVAAQRLDCPKRQGDLTRTSAAADGRSCLYAGEAGEEVTLQLMALNGRPAQQALSDIETELKAASPNLAAAGQAASVAGNVQSPDAEDREAVRDGDHTRVDLPGLHVNADGDRAQINLPGVHINADNGKADVNVTAPGGDGIRVHADENGAEIRKGRVTLKNVNVSYLLASDNEGQVEERAVGYVAKGPLNGPLVVARVKARGHDDDSDDLLKAVRRLVNRNLDRAKA